MLFQQADGGHNAVEGALPLPVHPVAVVELLGPVQGDAHQHMVLRQPPGPVLVQGIAVGLDVVMDPDPFGVGMAADVLRQVPEEVQPRQGGLPALEGESAVAVGVGQGLVRDGVHGLPGHAAQQGHGAVFRFIGVKAVTAPHVAAAGGRFDQQTQRGHDKTPVRQSRAAGTVRLLAILTFYTLFHKTAMAFCGLSKIP